MLNMSCGAPESGAQNAYVRLFLYRDNDLGGEKSRVVPGPNSVVTSGTIPAISGDCGDVEEVLGSGSGASTGTMSIL